MKSTFHAHRIRVQPVAELKNYVGDVDRIIYANPDRVPAEILRDIAPTGVYINIKPIFKEGYLELMKYLREESISHDYHRYGNLGLRSTEFEVTPKVENSL